MHRAILGCFRARVAEDAIGGLAAPSAAPWAVAWFDLITGYLASMAVALLAAEGAAIAASCFKCC